MKKQKSTVLLLLSPYILLIILLISFPFIWNVSLSFQSDQGLFSNYLMIFGDKVFGRVLKNTAIWTLSSVLLQLLLGINIAILLNQKVRGKAIFRAIILVLPWATPDIVAAISWKWIYNDLYGVLNDILLRINVISTPIGWLGDIKLAMASLVVANTWKGFAMSAMFYLAALQSINQEIIEAAKVDGASGLSIYRYILIPHLRTTIFSTVILTVIFTINYFPLIYTMTGGGPAQSTDSLVTWAYNIGFRFLNFPKSATVSTINFMFILVLSISYALIFSKKDEAEN